MKDKIHYRMIILKNIMKGKMHFITFNEESNAINNQYAQCMKTFWWQRAKWRTSTNVQVVPWIFVRWTWRIRPCEGISNDQPPVIG